MLAVLMFRHYLGSPKDLVFGTPPDTDGRSDILLDYAQNLDARMETVHSLARQQQWTSSHQQQAYDTRCHGEPMFVFWELGVDFYSTPTQGTKRGSV